MKRQIDEFLDGVMESDNIIDSRNNNHLAAAATLANRQIILPLHMGTTTIKTRIMVPLLQISTTRRINSMLQLKVMRFSNLFPIQIRHNCKFYGQIVQHHIQQVEQEVQQTVFPETLFLLMVVKCIRCLLSFKWRRRLLLIHPIFNIIQLTVLPYLQWLVEWNNNQCTWHRYIIACIHQDRVSFVAVSSPEYRIPILF